MSEKIIRTRADEDAVRIVCLELAIGTYKEPEDADDVAERAETYLAFINDEEIEGEGS